MVMQKGRILVEIANVKALNVKDSELPDFGIVRCEIETIYNKNRRGQIAGAANADQVIFTADLARIELMSSSASNPAFRHVYGKNADRLYKVFRHIFNIVGVESRFAFDESGAFMEPETVSRFLKDHASGLDLTKASDRYSFWAWNFEEAEPGLFNRFLEISHNRVVFCFEAAPSMLIELDRHEIPFINMRIDPVRFTGDLIMHISSNIADAFEGTHRFLYDIRIADIQAELIMLAGGHQSPIRKKVSKAAVIAGQTGTDFTTISNGQLRTLDDYADTLCEQVQDFDWVYIVPHPHGGMPCRPEINLLKRLGANAEIRFAAGYGFLLAPEVSHVFTVGSSLAVEARHFGKKATFLNRDPSVPVAVVERSYCRVGSAFFSPAFWAQVLLNLGVAVPERALSADLRLADSQIRDFFKVPWSYPFLSGGPVDLPVNFEGNTIVRLFNSGAVAKESETLIDDLSRLMLDMDLVGPDLDWHIATRAERGSEVSIQMFTDYSETLNSFDVCRIFKAI